MAILMTEQLAQQLIKHYEQCISEVKECVNVENAQTVCLDYSTQAGICFCVAEIFDKDIYSCEWIKSIPKTNRWHIAVKPERCDTIPDIINALQTRVDILKTFKNQ